MVVAWYSTSLREPAARPLFVKQFSAFQQAASDSTCELASRYCTSLLTPRFEAKLVPVVDGRWQLGIICTELRLNAIVKLLCGLATMHPTAGSEL